MILDTVYAQEDTKAIGAVQLESNRPGALEVSWDPPTETPRDYRISWAHADQDYPSRQDSSANAFPTDTSYTITGLDEGVRYKVRVRARYDGSSGPFSAPVEAVVASAAPTPTATAAATATATEAPIPTATATATPTATPATTPTPTSTPISTEESSNTLTSGGSGTASDPYIINDSTNVSAHSIRSYVASLQAQQSVYFRWDVGDRSGSWTVSIDASPTEHDFDLFGRDDRGKDWDDTDTSYDGDESITLAVQSNGYIYIRVQNYDGGAPTDLTLTIEPPGGG